MMNNFRVIFLIDISCIRSKMLSVNEVSTDAYLDSRHWL